MKKTRLFGAAFIVQPSGKPSVFKLLLVSANVPPDGVPLAPEDDVDVIDVDSVPATSGVAVGGEGEVYEYYYVYYDEDGNVVNKSETPAASPVVKDKVQEIPLTPVQSSAHATKNGIPNSSDVKPGDTPTIYAQIQNMETLLS